MNYFALLEAAGTAPKTGIFNNIYLWIAGYMVLIVAMFYFSGRPQKKREEAARKMQSALKVGDPILLNTGIFGKICDLYQDTAVVEIGTNKTVRVVVLRSEIKGVGEPDLTIHKTEE